MVPVELRLQNFLSYGTGAPPLEFDQFHVACLSGGNGQGKSALLDAITWAIWGQARKSSGSGKPDSDLLRIGTREMEVELVFDVEGERYRVVRSYRESATGKTSTPGLELHVYEAGAAEYRALTAPTMRETQEDIDRLLGINYDTFINSAFLLQGRSDEFTKKRPSERKQILANILNLDRYARLADRARRRERAAKTQLQQVEHEIERLVKAIEPESAWKEERDRTGDAVSEHREALEKAREQATALAQQLAALDARAQEASSQRKALESIDARVAALRSDAAELEERIEEADALLARSEDIRKRHERYQTLQKERDRLDEQRDLHRGIEKRVEQLQGQLRDHRNDLEKQLNRLEAQLGGHRSALNDCVGQLSRRASLQERLDRARAAQKRYRELEERRQQRDKLRASINEIEKQLAAQRQGLQSRLEAVESQIEEGKRELEARAKLQVKQRMLRQQVERLDVLREEHEAVVARGQELRESIRERRGRQATRSEELDEQRRLWNTFRESDDDLCPTCGTELTPRHRSEVERHYRDTIASLEDAVAGDAEVIASQEEERDQLRERFRALKEEAAGLDGSAEQLAALEENLRTLDARSQQVAAQREQAKALRQRLDDKAYARDERERRAALTKQIEQLSFDEATYEKVRTEAAQVERFEERMRELEEVAGRRDQLQQRIEQGEREVARVRERLGKGKKILQYQEQIEQLQKQLHEVGFDPERLNTVRQQCRELSDAGDRLNDLLHARQNREEWKKRLADVRERLSGALEEREQVAERLAKLDEELEGRAQVRERHDEAEAHRRELEAELHDHQKTLGELNAKLEQVGRDRKALKEQRAKRKEVDQERSLYRQLKKAFSKNGIPSLIIEQTLPEIEERANELLDRLTSGRMHVRLETLKDKKSGGTMETLDIIISDEQGMPRPYETFSGGEAFRVNFALRIALAQLLAERSGVRIRTLVIDEGFGTQDEQGVQRMVEAIQIIQDDFDKIVVITHLQDLKEAFPVRIEVEKDPVEGSSYELIGV